MTTWCSMSPIFPPSFHHAIHHTSGASPRSTVLLHSTRSSKSIFQTFSTALSFIEIYRILKHAALPSTTFIASSKRVTKHIKASIKISIYLATITPSLEIFLFTPWTPLHFALFPINIWTPDRMVHAAPLRPRSQLSKKHFQATLNYHYFLWLIVKWSWTPK